MSAKLRTVSSEGDLAQPDWILGRSSEAHRELLLADRAVSVPGTASNPCVIAARSAFGIWVEDVDGRRYMDLYGNNCHHVGYRHPRLTKALTSQLETLPFVPRGFANEPAVAFADRLRRLARMPEARVVSARSGADAIEVALAIAKAATGRSKTISFHDSYHGRSAGALSVGGRYEDRQGLGPLLPGALHVPPYYDRHDPCPSEERADAVARLSLDAMRAMLTYERDVAAVLGETIRNGPYRPPDWYWPAVRTLCDAHGTLLILDEIATGLGKTGALFNCHALEVRPDIICLGKALGGTAMPLSAVIADAGLDVPPSLNVGYFTHDKNPLCARAGLETLGIIEDEHLVENARCLGVKAVERLADVQARHDCLVGVRGEGLMISLELGPDRNGRRDGKASSALLYRACVERGVIPTFPRGASLTLSAPLVISESELDAMLDVVGEALGTIA